MTRREIGIGPWPLGIDNVHPADHEVFQPRMGPDAPFPRLRAATDLDLSDRGRARTRPPVGTVLALTAPEGLLSLGGRLFHQDDGTLYEGDTALITGLTQRALACSHAGLIFVSDGTAHYEIDAATVRTWGLPVPTLALAAVEGDLPAGTYHVRASFSDARKNEGGTSKVYAITLNGEQDIAVTVSGATADAVKVNLYAGRAQQRHTSFVVQVAPAATPYTLTTVSVSESDPPRTEGMTGPWTGLRGLLSFRAFLMFWRDNVLVRSEAQEPHLFHGDSIYPFPGSITAVEGLVPGAWIGTDAGLWWMSGQDKDTWIPERKTTAAVFPGSLQVEGWKVPAAQTMDMVAVFVAEDGVLVGLPGGAVLNLTPDYHFTTASRVSLCASRRADLNQLLIAVT